MKKQNINVQNQFLQQISTQQMLSARDINNLQQQLSNRYNFSHLRPSPEVYQTQIPQDQYFIQASSTKNIRRAFYNVQFTAEEKQKIEIVRDKLLVSQIPDSFYDQVVILKHLYEADLNPQQTFNRMKASYKFTSSPLITTFTEETRAGLEKGYIYTYGRDRRHKPICIVNIENYECEKSPQQIFNTVYFLMLVVLGVQAVPYHAEKCILVVDFAGFRVGNLMSYMGLYEVFKQMVAYYSGNLERTIIYHASSFQKIWHFIKGFIPEYARKRISFIDHNNFQEAYEFIDPSQLEQKFGGDLPNLQSYWPPSCPSDKEGEKPTQEESFSADYYSVNNDEAFFGTIEGEESLCGAANCSCCLF